MPPHRPPPEPTHKRAKSGTASAVWFCAEALPSEVVERPRRYTGAVSESTAALAMTASIAGHDHCPPTLSHAGSAAHSLDLRPQSIGLRFCLAPESGVRGPTESLCPSC